MSAEGCAASVKVLHPVHRLPDWVPEGARLYLSHVAAGKSLRAVARDYGCHASTVMRQVRRFENLRDDPLVDNALRKLDQALRAPPKPKSATEYSPMTAQSPVTPDLHATPDLEDHAMHFLQELTAPKAVLIVAADMPKAVVTREDTAGVPQRVAILDRELAEAMALKNWITCRKLGRVSSYAISSAGRLALRDYRASRSSLPAARFDDDDTAPRRARYGVIESPVVVLSRRRDKSGQPFLEGGLVQAAERMREDYVMAQLESVPTCSAIELMNMLETRAVPGPNIAPPGTAAARTRVLRLLRDLGEGLGDIALRCCCHLEGVESAENALGWSARSGKIVLRIALQRMSRHYACLGNEPVMIG
ncbi:MAG: helix-turn-helix domain containing protein [Rhodobacteraceae bacterium]|nr:MAG: helix-turn-helix domain containing protein [Paracoccaceae bacterium]